MQAQAYVAEAVPVESGRQGRLNQIKAEMMASWDAMSKAQDAIKYARLDYQAAKRRLERARKDLGAFVEVNMEYVKVTL